MNEKDVNKEFHIKSKEIVNKSEISDDDKKMWNEIIDKSSDLEILDLYYFLTSTPEKISWLTENTKKKIEILSEGNSSDWTDLLQKETNEINFFQDKEKLSTVRNKLKED
jgi:hypothetical protein